MATATPTELLTLLVEDEGYEAADDLFAEVGLSSVQPGICQTCYATASRMEPDQREGYCEECQSNTVISLGELFWEVY